MPDRYRKTISFYDQEALSTADRYDAIDRGALLIGLADFLDTSVKTILDIGAGHGTDAKRFAEEGRKVTAIEPSSGLLALGKERNAHPGIVWIDDTLPDLEKLTGQEGSFDLVLLNRVFMHVSPEDQERAFNRILDFVDLGGFVYMVIREGPSFDARYMYGVDYTKLSVISNSRDFSLSVSAPQPDVNGRSEITWRYLCIRNKA